MALWVRPAVRSPRHKAQWIVPARVPSTAPVVVRAARKTRQGRPLAGDAGRRAHSPRRHGPRGQPIDDAPEQLVTRWTPLTAPTSPNRPGGRNGSGCCLPRPLGELAGPNQPLREREAGALWRREVVEVQPEPAAQRGVFACAQGSACDSAVRCRVPHRPIHHAAQHRATCAPRDSMAWLRSREAAVERACSRAAGP